MKKVLHISNYYYPHIGGIEQVARDCVHSLDGKYEQKLICFNHEKEDRVDQIDGIDIIRPGCFAKVFSQSLSFSYGKILKKTVQEFQPDVIIFHYPNPFVASFLLPILKKNPQIKFILYWHLDIIKQKLLKHLFHGQNKALIARADKIVATSPNYIQGSSLLLPVQDKCVVVPNCVSDDRLTPIVDQTIAQNFAAQNQGKTVCFALGRHVPYKGMEYLVRAAKYLSDDFVVYIGGNGELTEQLKQLAEGDKKVVFTGRLSDEEVKAYLQGCDVFCFPSITKNEAFGIALAEAMAYGKPAVTFTIEGSGVNYVSLNGVTGIEVPNSDSKAFAQAIQTLAQNAELRKTYGEAARARVNELFTFGSFQKNICQLLSEVTL